MLSTILPIPQSFFDDISNRLSDGLLYIRKLFMNSRVFIHILLFFILFFIIFIFYSFQLFHSFSFSLSLSSTNLICFLLFVWNIHETFLNKFGCIKSNYLF